MDQDAVAREEKLLAAKKKLKKYQKKKAGGIANVSSGDATSATPPRRTSAELVNTPSTEANLKVKANESKTQDEEYAVVAALSEETLDVQSKNLSEESTIDVTGDSLNNEKTNVKLVEGHKPIVEPHGQQNIILPTTTFMDATIAEKSGSPATEETVSFEDLANLCRTQRQTISVLVEEKSGLTTELEKYTAMADRFKRSEELLEEGQLLVDALRRQNAELEEKIRTGQVRLKEAGEETERALEDLKSQKQRAEKLEKDNSQLTSQLTTKDSIIEQLTAEKAKIRSTSGEVERLSKSLQDKEDRCEALEIELSNIRHKLANAEQQVSDKEEKLATAERISKETKEKFESLNAQITSLTAESIKLQQQLANLTYEHETKSKEAANHYEQLTFKSNIAQELHIERESLAQELQSLQAENTKLSKRIKDITTKIDGLSSENLNLISQLTELREKNVEISNEKFALAEEVDREKTRAVRFEQESTKYRKQYEELYSQQQPGNAIDSTYDQSSSLALYQQAYYYEQQRAQNLEYQLSQYQAAYNNETSEKLDLDVKSDAVPAPVPLYFIENPSIPLTASSVTPTLRQYPTFSIGGGAVQGGTVSNSKLDFSNLQMEGCAGCMGELIIV